MLTQEQLKKKDFKIFLGMPMYGGMLSEATLHGLLELQQWSMAHNVGMRIQTMGNESLITRARNTIVSMMMEQTDYVATHLLFIDADIGFSWKNIERLICAEKDIACGIYPRKHLHFEKVANVLANFPNATPDEIEAKILGYNVNFDDNATTTMPILDAGSSTVYFYHAKDNSNWDIMINSEMISTSEVGVTLAYMTDL